MKKIAVYEDVVWIRLVDNILYYMDDYSHLNRINPDISLKTYDFKPVVLELWGDVGVVVYGYILKNQSEKPLDGEKLEYGEYLLHQDSFTPIFADKRNKLKLIIDSERLIVSSYEERQDFSIYFKSTESIVSYPPAYKGKFPESVISNEIHLSSIYPNLYGDKINDGQNVWELDFSKIFAWDEIYWYSNKAPKVVDGIIYQCLRDKYYKNFAFVAVDGLTGEILFRDNDFLGLLYPHNGYLYTIYPHKILRRNPKTFELEEFDIDMADAPKLYFEEKKCFFKDDKLFFAAKDNDKDGICPYWGILDLNTMKIIHWEILLRDPKKKRSLLNLNQVHEIVAYDDKVVVKVPMQILLYQR